MATAMGASSCLVGPVPFKDVVGGDDDEIISPPKEYVDIISTMPTTTIGALLARQCQGAWLADHMVPGLLSFQRRFMPRPSDVLLASPPKCGTTWLKALSFATMARAVYPPAGDDHHPLLHLNPHDCVPFMDDLFSVGQEAKLDAMPSPRLMNTHLQHSLLPPSVAHNPDCKIVYVCREPRDMLISLWHFIKGHVPSRYTFPDLFEDACEGKQANGPIWDHVLGYWQMSQAKPERVLFLRYEEMLLDPISNVIKLAQFIGVPFTVNEKVVGLPAYIVKLCSIETLRGVGANKIGGEGIIVKFPHASYFRKGMTGDWVNHMTPEMAQRFDAIVEDKLQGSGLSFKS